MNEPNGTPSRRLVFTANPHPHPQPSPSPSPLPSPSPSPSPSPFNSHPHPITLEAPGAHGSECCCWLCKYSVRTASRYWRSAHLAETGEGRARAAVTKTRPTKAVLSGGPSGSFA